MVNLLDKDFPVFMETAYCRVHNSPPYKRILRQFNTIHHFKYYFSQINFNIIPPSTPTSRKWSLPLRYIIPSTCSKCPAYLNYWSYNLNNMLWRVNIMKFFIIQFVLGSFYLLSLRFTYSSIISSQTPSIYIKFNRYSVNSNNTLKRTDDNALLGIKKRIFDVIIFNKFVLGCLL